MWGALREMAQELHMAATYLAIGRETGDKTDSK